MVQDSVSRVQISRVAQSDPAALQRKGTKRV